MDISPFIQTAFGAIVGGGVVLATNWLTTRAEKKKQTQEWWEQRYITEGIDRLAVYLKGVQIYALNMNLSVGTNPPITYMITTWGTYLGTPSLRVKREFPEKSNRTTPYCPFWGDGSRAGQRNWSQ